MQARVTVQILLVGSLCLGCALSKGHQRLLLPVPDRVSRITLTKADPNQSEQEAPTPRYPIIEDRERIGQIIKFLNLHGSDWQTPKGELPRREYLLQIETDGGKHLMVLLGGDWIGGPVGNSDQLQRLNAKDMQKFREILQISAN